MLDQQVIIVKNNYEAFDNLLMSFDVKKLFLVCGHFVMHMDIGHYFEKLEKRIGVQVIFFHDFTPNPDYESVVKGVRLFRKANCSMIAAVGGGSAIDVAKCIKLYANMEPIQSYLSQKIIPNQIRLLAMPTTAGTGSEATKFAVIYQNGEKQSISHESCIPSVAVLDSSTLKSLPEYIRKTSMMDAFCHAIEAFWSIHSTKESRAYSVEAIKLILKYKDPYLANLEEGNNKMLQGAHIAGKAINIAQTTAGHAMCYKLTSLYGIAHGHAAALCVAKLWPYMLLCLDRCIDSRGEKYLKNMFLELALSMGCSKIEAAMDKFNGLVNDLGLYAPAPVTRTEIHTLKTSVNPIRLKNTPVLLNINDMEILYNQILNVEEESK